MNVLTQPDARDWLALPEDARDYQVDLGDGVRGWRIAYSPNLGFAEVEPEIAEIVERAVHSFAELGAVVEIETTAFRGTKEVFRVHWLTAAAHLLKRFTPQQKEPMDPDLLHVAEQGAAIPMLDLREAMQRRGELGIELNRFHQVYDLLLTPALPIAAFDVGRNVVDLVKQTQWTDWTPFSYPFNLTQQPAASIPCGLTKDGLPVGLQIVGPRYADARVLRAARAFESLHPIPLRPS